MGKKILYVVLLVAAPLLAGDPFYDSSQASLAGANVLDAASSWGKPEVNALVADASGHFAVQGLIIKVAAVGAVIVAERLWTKRHPSHRRFIGYVNYALTSATLAVAAHNFTVGAP